VGFGDGREKNWEWHLKSNNHKKIVEVLNSKSASNFTNFFKSKPWTAASGPSTLPVPSSSALLIPTPSTMVPLVPTNVFDIVEVDDIDDRAASIVGLISDLRHEILGKLRTAINTLPQTVTSCMKMGLVIRGVSVYLYERTACV
jgi:hypothetical protein